MDPTAIDLLALREKITTDLGTRFLPGDPLNGKTVVHERVCSFLACSQLEAEQVVDTLAARGFMIYRENAASGHPGAWQLGS